MRDSGQPAKKGPYKRASSLCWELPLSLRTSWEALWIELIAIFQKVQKVANFNHEMRALPTRCQRLPLPLLVCVVTLWRGMGHILATHGSSHLAKVSLNVFVYHYSPCQPACACVPHPSFVSSWVGSEMWHIKSICVWWNGHTLDWHEWPLSHVFFHPRHTVHLGTDNSHLRCQENWDQWLVPFWIILPSCAQEAPPDTPVGGFPVEIWTESPLWSQAARLSQVREPDRSKGELLCPQHCLGVVSSVIQLWRLTGKVGSPCNPRRLAAVLHWKRPTNENCR